MRKGSDARYPIIPWGNKSQPERHSSREEGFVILQMTECESRAESLLRWICGWVTAPSLRPLLLAVSTCREQSPSSLLWVPPAPALPKSPVISAQWAPEPRHGNQAQLPYRKGMGFCSILNRIHLYCTSVWGEEHRALPLLASTENAARICSNQSGKSRGRATNCHNSDQYRDWLRHQTWSNMKYS